MTLLHQIGNYQFLSLTRPPEGLKQSLEVETRGGVDGVVIRKLGIRGQPFSAISTLDPPGATAAAALLNGRAVYRAYETLIDDEPQSVIWASIAETAFRVKVLNTRLLELVPMSAPRGGLNSGAAILRVEWILLPVKV